MRLVVTMMPMVVLAFLLTNPTDSHGNSFCSFGQLPPTIPERAAASVASFVGYAVKKVDDHPGDHFGTETTTFLVEQSWRGPRGGLVSITTPKQCGAFFVPGQTYLIVAPSKRSDGRYFMPANGGPSPSTVSDYPPLIAYADSLILQLGKPVWSAPPAGQRSYDRSEPPLAAAGGHRVLILVANRGYGDFAGDTVVAELTLAKSETRGRRSNIRFFEFRGLARDVLYRVRLTTGEGRTEDHYFMLSCEGSNQELCSASSIVYPGSTWPNARAGLRNPRPEA